jgi:hypothetical protein
VASSATVIAATAPAANAQAAPVAPAGPASRPAPVSASAAATPAAAPAGPTSAERFGRLRDAHAAQRWLEVLEESIPVATALARDGKAESVEMSEVLLMRGDALRVAGDAAAAHASYRASLDAAERAAGPQGTALLLPLERLADAARAAGLREEEVELVARSLAILRRRDGLRTAGTDELQGRLIDGLAALGRFDAAEREALTQLRAAESRYGTDSPALLPALDAVATLYSSFAAGAQARPHLERMVRLLETGGSPDDPRLLKPLLGLSRSHALEYRFGIVDPRTMSVHADRTADVRRPVENAFAPPLCVTDPRTGLPVCQQVPTPFTRPNLPPRLSTDGEAPLLRALRIAEAQPSVTPFQRGVVHVEAGDWFLLRGEAARAHEHYRKAWTLLADPAGRPTGFENPLRAPRQLLYRRPASTQDFAHLPAGKFTVQSVVTEFTVRPDGRVGDVRTVEENTNLRRLEDARAAVRGAVFAPRLENGEPVATEGVRIVENFPVPR